MVKREDALVLAPGRAIEVVNLDLEDERSDGNTAATPQLLRALEAIGAVLCVALC